MDTRVFDGIKFCKQSLQKTFQETFMPSFVQTGLEIWEEKISKEIVEDAAMADGHITSRKLPLSMLCSGKLKKSAVREQQIPL